VQQNHVIWRRRRKLGSRIWDCWQFVSGQNRPKITTIDGLSTQPQVHRYNPGRCVITKLRRGQLTPKGGLAGRFYLDLLRYATTRKESRLGCAKSSPTNTIPAGAYDPSWRVRSQSVHTTPVDGYDPGQHSKCRPAAASSRLSE